jgi:photosystem II stability/assembly factor-like uncharacterized protein
MRIPRLLFLVLHSVVGFAQSDGQVNAWISRGPEGGVVARPVIDPQNPRTLYVATAGRVFKTSDAAGHWSALGEPGVLILAVDPQDPNTLYGSNNNVPYKSTDGGLTWKASGAGLPCPCSSLTLVIDPANSSTLYAAYEGTSGDVRGGVLKSTDGGATWSSAGSGLPVYQPPGFRPYSAVKALVIDPKNPSTLYAAPGLILSAGGGIFKSTDGAMSWNAVNSGLPDNFFISSLAIDPRKPNTLYVSSRGSLFNTTDGGSSWATLQSSSPSVQNLVVDPQDSDTLYAVSGRGIVKSADSGGSWNKVLSEETLTFGTAWVAVAPGDGGASTVYAGGNGRGVFKSTNGGLTWVTTNSSGLIASSIGSLAIDPQNPRRLLAGVGGAGLLKSSDGATNWSRVPALPTWEISSLAIDPWSPATVYATLSDGLHKSVDGGESWLLLPTDSQVYIRPLAIDPQNPDIVYSGRYKSTDGGASWEKLAFLPTALALDPQNSGTLYAGSMTGGDIGQVSTISSGVLKSVDGGKSWSGLNTLWKFVLVSAVAVDPSNSNVVYAQTTNLDCDFCTSDYYANPDVLKNVGLFRSADGGETWMKLGPPDADPGYNSFTGIDVLGTLYVRARGGVFRSQNGGATWSALPALPATGLSSAVTVLAFDPQDPNHFFAGTYGAGVFEITLAEESTAR